MLSFGTDGVRGVANTELTPELVLLLGRVAARVLGNESFVVGRDTRLSSPLLQAALSAGLAGEGADVVDLGVVPTPAVAYACQVRGVPGAVLSASHNPYPDNGVKLFAAGGLKLRDDVEARLESAMRTTLGPPQHAGAAVGRLSSDAGAAGAYVDHLVESLDGRDLRGLSVVLDCGNGAACGVAPDVLRRLGADVAVLFDAPDGTNINAGCGSTDPTALREAVVARRADVGLAFDGDADRVVAVDQTGAVVDGDHVIALCAVDLRERGRLNGDTVVVTVMTNLGFRLAMADEGIEVHETAVGDRYVLEALEQGGWSLGGEQSGHVVFRDLATTGDGILTGIQLLDLVHRRSTVLSDLAASAMTRLPQVLRSVRVADRESLPGAADVWDEVAKVDAELAGRGRVLLRASGTEPVVRVMAEAHTEAEAEAAVDRLCHAVVASLGPGHS